MARDKERSINPAQAQRKLDKQKAVKKGKAEVQARRNEKLGRRNPDRLQRQIDDLKALEASGQPLKSVEKKALAELERDVVAIRKAREALGDSAPTFGRERRRDRQEGKGVNDSAVLGKRRRDDRPRWRSEDDGSETDDSVRNIPMPKDTPPPVPPQHPRNGSRNPNAEPLGIDRDVAHREPHALPAKPVVQHVKTVYESAPVVRNLRQEAVSKFVPAVVRRRQEAIKGQGRLLEPEELDRFERHESNRGQPRTFPQVEVDSKATEDSNQQATFATDVKSGHINIESRLAEEEERFRREMMKVQIEEVEDEDL